MSSMVRLIALSLLSAGALAITVPLLADDASSWDQARAQLVSGQAGPMAQGVARWQQLSASSGYGFADYAGFILAHPGFPDEDKLQAKAEARLLQETADPGQVVAFFDSLPPLTNPARARYAVALDQLGRSQAAQTALDAWRGGTMAEADEMALLARHGAQFTPAEDNRRMDALLWQRDISAARRQLARTSPYLRDLFAARIASADGTDPAALGLALSDAWLSDPGYLFNRARQLRKAGRKGEAAELLASRPALARLPFDAQEWVEEQLVQARGVSARDTVRIAGRIDDAFAPGADISRLGFTLRDDYTSLMWLGGTTALRELGDPASAAPLFYRYGAAARTPQTRAKGFYWAGRAADRAGDRPAAMRYYELAAGYSERFYGLLALERLGRPMPRPAPASAIQPGSDERSEFFARPLTLAVREVARDAQWSVGVRFYKEIAAQAQDEADHVLVAELARQIGRRDLAVILGEAAGEHGHFNFSATGFPTIAVPAGSDWTMVHAIIRQESQFAQNAISHAGARGLMQLMPGTAREQAGKLNLSYTAPALFEDPAYNIRLGDGYFARMLAYYSGSYPLAVAAYNAGPGNVNRWLRSLGDPRTGAIDWVDWIERIPLSETRNYVQRVLENAVVYEALYPERATRGQARGIGVFLGSDLGS